ncbi:uncharacterized protein EV154DRAFT_488974 [Mucor mucedo]|uniref:uncharacterized protein n=1 Tax=Mucor mucedo TaxID=29922 RepID=UPI00221F2D1B|nr:uncharacterized protein EV154DRAFT_488974 [Mucor mucedo]KAI7864087.1 hypothetical protein EV154DRAFT_488974 [Mucor mucedo]
MGFLLRGTLPSFAKSWLRWGPDSNLFGLIAAIIVFTVSLVRHWCQKLTKFVPGSRISENGCLSAFNSEDTSQGPFIGRFLVTKALLPQSGTVASTHRFQPGIHTWQ